MATVDRSESRLETSSVANDVTLTAFASGQQRHQTRTWKNRHTDSANQRIVSYSKGEKGMAQMQERSERKDRVKKRALDIKSWEWWGLQ